MGYLCSPVSDTAPRFHAVFVLPRFSGGGAERVALTLAARLPPRGFAVTLVALSAEGPLLGTVPAEVKVIALGRTRLSRAIPRLVRAIRRLRPDAVVSTFGYVNLALLATRWSYRAPIVVREANLPSASLHRVPWPAGFHRAMRLLYPAAAKVVCSSELMAREMRSDFGVADPVVLPNPVDVARLRAEAAAPHRRPGPGRRLVAVGRLTHQKGLDRLLEALARLDAEDTIELIGTGEEEPALRTLAHRLGLDARVTFHGFVGTPAAWIAGADALVLPSRWEGMPNAALEALAVGTPVVATPEAGAIAELAAAAPADAVTTAAAGRPLVEALRAIAPAGAPPTPRPSILPPEHEADRVADRFAELLRDVAREHRRAGTA